MKYSVVDLFSGAGGLSLGFEQTGQFEIKAAYENNIYAQKTYKQNHPDVWVYDDVCAANFHEVKQKFGSIDVVIGGPPCQGFSNANRQRNQAISKNNMLVKQFIRAVMDLQPKAFVMENVSMLKSDVHRFYMENGDEQMIEEYNIPTMKANIVLLEALYLFPGAENIVRNSQLLRAMIWREDVYQAINIVYKQRRNAEKLEAALNKHKAKLLKAVRYLSDLDSGNEYILKMNLQVANSLQDYYNSAIAADAIPGLLVNAIMVQRMLGKALEIIENNIVVDAYSCDFGLTAKVRSFAVFDYVYSVLGSEKQGYAIASDVLCAADFGAPQKRMRFVIIGVKKSISQKAALPNGKVEADEYATVRDAIGDLADVAPVFSIDAPGIFLENKSQMSSLAKMLRDSDTLQNHVITETTDIAMKRFAAIKPGQNLHSLDQELITNTYTDASRTQNTVYLRLDYDEPSGTVINVRKSMWIHPQHNRAISIREAARLQTFPDSFVFCGSKNSQYQQVGNAVPPVLAKAIAKKVYRLLDKGHRGNINHG